MCINVGQKWSRVPIFGILLEYIVAITNYSLYASPVLRTNYGESDWSVYRRLNLTEISGYKLQPSWRASENYMKRVCGALHFNKRNDYQKCMNISHVWKRVLTITLLISPHLIPEIFLFFVKLLNIVYSGFWTHFSSTLPTFKSRTLDATVYCRSSWEVWYRPFHIINSVLYI